MKRLNLLFTALVLTSLNSCALLSNINWNADALNSALAKSVTAVSLSDQEIIELCKQTVAQLDKSNTIEKGAYDARLKKITKNFKVDGLKLDFKVYKKDEINAFACGDGSVRVYTGLMDLMTDEEVAAVLGHEIGHVVHQDSKNAMKKAYLASAAADLVGAAGSVGALTQAVVGNIAEAYVNAQYSQKQEYAADEYGFKFALQCGYDKYSMYNALHKLAGLSAGSPTSKLSQRFADHPDSESRAARVKEMADKLQ